MAHKKTEDFSWNKRIAFEIRARTHRCAVFTSARRIHINKSPARHLALPFDYRSLFLSLTLVTRKIVTQQAIKIAQGRPLRRLPRLFQCLFQFSA